MGIAGRIGVGLLVLLVGIPVVLTGGAAVGSAVVFVWSEQAVADIDPELRAIYEAATLAQCEAMPPSLLAALHMARSGRSSPQYPWVSEGINDAGQAGPYAINLGDWESSWGRDGDVDGDANVYDVVDASHAVAAVLCLTGGIDGAWLDLPAALGVFGYEAGTEGFEAVVAWVDAYTETVAGLPLVLVGVDGFVCPVQGAYHYIDDWGFPRSGGRVHQGIDIFAPRGTPVVAVTDGVFRSGSNSLGGLVAYTTEPDGTYFYYAHLDSLAGVGAGSAVVAGQLIGYVGNSGNAVTTPTHLHFEIHPQGGVAVRPWPWISEACPLG